MNQSNLLKIERSYLLKIERNGEIRYCAEIIGFPITLRFIRATDPEIPYHFSTKPEAMEYWRLFQRYKPADTSDWIASVEEVYI